MGCEMVNLAQMQAQFKSNQPYAFAFHMPGRTEHFALSAKLRRLQNDFLNIEQIMNMN